MQKFIDFFLYPERSNLQMALWLARFLVILAILWLLRALYFLGKVSFMFVDKENSTLLLQTAGVELLRSAQETFGLAVLALILSHVLVFSIVYLRDNKHAARQPRHDENGSLSSHE